MGRTLKVFMDSLVVIGNFDGVHLGHRAVLEGAEAEGAALGLAVKVLTFHPHPAEALGRKPPARLTTQARKRELIAAMTPAIELVEQRFDIAYAGQSPAEFADRLLAEHRAKRVVVGKNFRFGKGRAGDFDQLLELGAARGFSARSEALRGDASGPWSSTRIRSAIARGDLDDAARVLGRPHMLSGSVVRGKQLGRTIGFPTANLDGISEALPSLGVYAAQVERRDGKRWVSLGKGAMSIGKNPTTDSDDRVKAEVYVLDFDGDLYGCELRTHLIERLRGEQKFDSMAELISQIQADVDATRAGPKAH